VPPVLSRETKIVLVNALYFKAEWQQSFFEEATMKKKFHPNGLSDDYHIMVDMMATGGEYPHYYDEETNIDVVGFPYKQNCSTMYVMLPRQSSIDVIKQKQKLLTGAKIDEIIDKMTLKTAVILFPKMHLKSGFHLKDELKDLGIDTFFSRNADMSLIAEDRKHPGQGYAHGQVKGKSNQGWHHGQIKGSSIGRNKRNVGYKVESENKKSPNPLTMKDFLLRKRIVKSSSKNKLTRAKRETDNSLELLEKLRNENLPNPGLFADEVIHKVDLNMNEKGTEGMFEKFSFASGDTFTGPL
jgi:Serpin (serine protease inhibitor)